MKIGPTLLDQATITGKSVLLAALHFEWVMKHPEESDILSKDFFNFAAILFESSDAPNARDADPDRIKQWWYSVTKEDFEKGKNLHFPLMWIEEEDGSRTRIKKPPEL
ncbi:MAG: hypothetical protein Sw2PiBPW_39870 [Shewanella algae]